MLRQSNSTETKLRRNSARPRRPALRVGTAVIRDYRAHGTRAYEIDFGKVLGGPRLRYYKPSQTEAIEFARTKSNELERHGDAALLLTTAQRVEAARCFSRIADAKATLTEAVDYWIQQHPAEHRGKTIAIVAAELVAKKEAGNRRERYIKDLRWKLEAFEKAFPNRELATITTPELEAWFATKGWAPVSYRSYAETLHVLFNYAVVRRYCTTNPIAAMEMPRRDHREPCILTVDQTRALLSAARADTEFAECLPYVAIGTFAGIRPEEIVRMDWAEVDITHKTIVVLGANAKGRDRRVVDMSDNLAAWLALTPARPGKILTKGLRYYRDRLKSVLGWEKWPHDVMRHSFASYHLAQHHDQSLTTAMLGHRSKDILWQHYRALVMPTAAAEFWNIYPERQASAVTGQPGEGEFTNSGVPLMAACAS